MRPPYVLIGARFGVVWRLLRRHGLSWRPRYLWRALVLLQAGLWASFLAWRQRRVHGEALRRAPVPDDPLIIVGHWRTGSTLLHQLLALDPALAAPTTFQCAMPDSFIISKRYAAPLLGRVIHGTRPMDNVAQGLDEPQEEEWALVRMTGLSPLASLAFGPPGRFFLDDDPTMLPNDPAALKHWRQALKRFCRALALHTGRRPVLKNPFHSTRIPQLLQMFPRARFICIRRDPLQVVPSARHLWTVVARDNRLRPGFEPPSVSEVARAYRRITDRLDADLAQVPRARRAELSFDALVADPLAAITGLYHELDLPLGDDFVAAVRRRLARLSGYRKNRYTLTEAEQQEIRRISGE